MCSRFYVLLENQFGMPMKFFFYIGCIFVIFSCNDRKITEKQLQKNITFSEIYEHDAVLKIAPKFQSEIDDWKEYQKVRIFLSQYENISPNDALNNSRELNEISKNLGDSIKPLFLETPAFKARINLFFNETLRLYDMSSITAIKTTQINRQVAKVLNAFSSINLKINGILEQRELEQRIGDADTILKRDFPENFEKTQNLNRSRTTTGRRVSKKSEEEKLLEKRLLEKEKMDVRKIKNNNEKKNN